MMLKEVKMITNARLISYSQPSEYDAIEGLEDVQDLIAFCAKVSNPTSQINNSTSEKLITYLVKHKHWSPLEMASACIEIETTRDIAHQIVRHRSFAFQEFSQRYAEPSQMGDSFTTRECRLQDTTNRQNSIETDDSNLKKEWELHQNLVIRQAEVAYKWAIDNGIAKEQARVVLPEGCTKTRLYMNGSLRSWIHYIELRGSNGTQKEHMEVAQKCAIEIAKIFPLMEKL
jgi:thymidylate synthase (FAD)|tara:strand:- start:1913 stop:2602 length:690 start_codon:yes stop_codon:yes gene_type:complete